MPKTEKYKDPECAETMTYVFGPVPSRRLGLSLGVDLIPLKTCSYDCLYCQVGTTTCLTVEPRTFAPPAAVIKEVKRSLERITPDVVTFSGSGEPTLHSGIGEAIASVKALSDLRVAVLTNGSLLWREEVREGLVAADVIMPTLSTTDENLFRKIHRPHPGLLLSHVIQGLKSLRKIYSGELDVEVVLLAGLNDGPRQLEGLRKVLEDIKPDRIQLNTVVRPPADALALSLDREKMEEVKTYFGEKAEIIASIPPKQMEMNPQSLTPALMEMAKRRPIRVLDAAQALAFPAEEAERLIKGLVAEGRLFPRVHLGETYFTSGK